MNSKERVYASIRRNHPDHIPRYLWFHPDLLAEFGRQYGTVGFATEAAIGNDILQPWVSINRSMSLIMQEGASFTDDFGITWVRRGRYNTPVRHPLEGADVDAIRAYPMPDPGLPARYQEVDSLISDYGSAHFIGADISGSIFEPAYHLRGMESLLIDLATNSSEAAALLDMTTQFTLDATSECTRRELDWVWLGDDVGMQSGMTISPATWRKHLRPRMKRIIDGIRSIKPDMIIAYHSCGCIRPIIRDLIDIGIDVLNPLQPMAAEMDNTEIKREFGAQVTLMAGIDTQDFMRTATPAEVRNETHRIIDVMGEGNGFIFAGSHAIQPDVPWENIETLLDTLNNQ